MNITVYCGARDGADGKFAKEAAALGAWIGKNGHTLVYGGGQNGLMGVVADACLEQGGPVIGVIPDFLMEMEQMHLHTTEMIHVKTMSERRNIMIEKGDAFVALPGGVGTLEEISEIISHIHLGLIRGACLFYNQDHYYDPMKALLQNMADWGFYPEEDLKNILFAENLAEIEAELCKNC
ncbi:MAG TPA: TIGR00730 family Rossman fold protein [Clostridiales bacterium]|nr:TIGR00730 family Rossman fold protein [Clostridiales bacterium]